MTTSDEPTLRARQAAVAREAILRAVVEMLESDEADVISLAEVAERAGVSRRTLYRYFATRDDLIAAAGDWIFEREVELPAPPQRSEDIVAFMYGASSEAMRRVRLTRALMKTQAGREIVTPSRRARDEAFARALEDLVAGLDEAEAKRITAMIRYLLGARTWLALHDEYGLELDEAQAAMAWALEALIADARRRAEQAPAPPSRRSGRARR